MRISDIDSDFEFFKEKSKFGNCLAVLINEKTGKKEYIWGSNIVSLKGNRWYATRAAAEASNFQVIALRLGINSTAVSNTDSDVGTSFTSCGLSIDTGYPMTSDADTDNTGRGSTVNTWRVTYATTDVSQAGIIELVLADSKTAPTNILNRAKFAAAFDKTSADTLKVFVNHQMLGV